MDTHRTERNRATALGAIVAFALAVPTGALAWVTAVDADDQVALPAEHEDQIACMVELTDADLAEVQAEEDALAAHLDGLGIAYTMEDLGFTGFRYVEWDTDDEAANDAVAGFLSETYPLAPDEVAMLNTDADALAAHLDAAGVDHTVETDPNGVRWVEWDESDPAAEAAADEFYDLTPEVVAELNAETDALVAHLEAAGIEHEVTTDPDGTRWVEWDESDPAANAAVDEFSDDWSPDDAGGGLEEADPDDVTCEG